MKARKAPIKRQTKETSIIVSVNIDGTGKTSVSKLELIFRSSYCILLENMV